MVTVVAGAIPCSTMSVVAFGASAHSRLIAVKAASPLR
jgi:hypothetical protein